MRQYLQVHLKNHWTVKSMEHDVRVHLEIQWTVKTLKAYVLSQFAYVTVGLNQF